MRKQITLGLIAGALALSTAAFAPTEAQANNNQKALNQLAMQMYMNNVAQQQAQQQYYNNVYNPYYGNPYYNNGYYNRVISGNGCYNNHWNSGWHNGYNNLRYNSSTVGRILNRVF